MEVSTRWRLAALALFGTLLAWHSYDVATPGLTDRSGRLKAPDFLQFYTYGALVAGGQAADLYDADAHAAIARRLVDPRLTLSAFVPNYSPVIAWLAAPLARLPFPTAMAVFALVSAALYGAAVATLASVTARIKTDVKTAVLVAAAFPAVFITLRYGQISPLSLLILAAATAAAARGRPWLAGASLGLLVYKPNLLLAPGLLLLAAGQWRLLMGLMVGAGAELALNLALVGPDVMRQYPGSAGDAGKAPRVGAVLSRRVAFLARPGAVAPAVVVTGHSINGDRHPVGDVARRARVARA